MVVFGLVSSVFDLLTFGILLLVLHADQATFQTTWFVISLLTELAVVLVLRTRWPAIRSRPSRLLLWTTVVVSVVPLSIPFLDPLASAFGFVPLSGPQLLVVVLVLAGYIATTEATKAWFYRTSPVHR
jgi:Mg2+-importing ATPase